MKAIIDSIPIADVIKALLDLDNPLPAQFLYVFSDISESDLAEVRKIWEDIAVNRKVYLFAELERLMETDTLLAFDEIAHFALSDSDPNVRSKSISLLWECEDPRLAGELSIILEQDQNEMVQLSAAAALGRYVLLGELDEIPQSITNKVRELLLRVFSSHPSKEIQQEVFKSLSFASLPEIDKMISSKFNDPDLSWQLAAIIAMGRSADERWEKPILKTLHSPNLPHQIEAVRSAGELELTSARLPLLDMLNAHIQDEDLRFQVIWSLSKIGGEEVKETLEKLLDSADSEDEVEIIELALEHLAFNDELPSLDIF